MAVDIHDPPLVQPFCVLSDIFRIIPGDLPLCFQRTGVSSLFDESSDDVRHAAENTEFGKSRVQHRELRFGERGQGLHVFQDLIDQTVIVSFCPKVLFKVQPMHLVVRFGTHCVAFDPLVIDTKHRTAADDIETTVAMEKLQRRSDVRKFLDLIEDKHRFSGNKLFRRVKQRDVSDNVVDIVAAFGDALVFLFFYEVEKDDVVIVL